VAQNADDLLQTVYSDGASGIRDQLLQEGAWQGELQQIKKDGNPVYVSADWVLFSDGQDKQPSVIATHTDITSRIQVQRELEDANKRLQSMARELERSNAELEEFARIASHDLSTPITSARWLVELLAARHAGSLDAEGQKMLQQITVGLQRMTDLVEAILSHARVGTEPIGAPKPVSADQALDMALANLQKDVNLSGAVVRREPMPQLLIEAQPLAQLFQNLIANAIKYRREGIAPEITIQARAHDGMWLLSVSDNGMGIEPEWFERIFQPMQRLHSAKIAGSGIGLATCRKIVTRAGGQIWVESTVGSGSTFFFTLPGPEAH
jgi:light-regulated signal transduction histidine kinase (bacteriophytochrome)